MGQTELLAGDADAVPVAQVGLEIQIAPPPAGASPQQAAAAQMIAANPAELLLGVRDIRMLAITHEEVLRCLAERVVLALDRIVALIELLVALAAMGELPRLHPLGDVVLTVLDVSAPLDDERAQSMLGELFGRPAAGDPGSDDDRIVLLVALWRHRRGPQRADRARR